MQVQKWAFFVASFTTMLCAHLPIPPKLPSLRNDIQMDMVVYHEMTKLISLRVIMVIFVFNGHIMQLPLSYSCIIINLS